METDSTKGLSYARCGKFGNTGFVVVPGIIFDTALLAVCPVRVVTSLDIELCKLASVEEVDFVAKGLASI